MPALQLAEPGKPGNPQGYSKHHLWRSALLRVLNDKRPDENGKKTRTLVLVAQSLVREALNGQRWAHEMIADRIDGPLLKEATGSAGVTVIVNRRGDIAVDAGKLEPMAIDHEQP